MISVIHNNLTTEVLVISYISSKTNKETFSDIIIIQVPPPQKDTNTVTVESLIGFPPYLLLCFSKKIKLSLCFF
jgi:hypothetical protein